MQQKINYVGLLILIILGVAIGNLTSSWFTAKYNNKHVDKGIEKETIAVPKVLSETPSKAKKSAEPKQQPALPEQAKRAESVRETVKLSPNNQTKADEIKPPANSKKLMEQRKLDENGLRLSKKCNEWTTVHKDMNTPSSERGMNKHCSEYYDYLSFGNLPDAS